MGKLLQAYSVNALRSVVLREPANSIFQPFLVLAIKSDFRTYA